MKCLVLFSGTGSIEKIFSKSYECRGVDIDNYFNPYYNVDILKWDYKDELKSWTPDYIHSSPVCKNYTNLKTPNKKKPSKEDLDFSYSLVKKTLEIIEYVKLLNPKLKYTIENPRGLMRYLDIMKPLKRITTSYCKYGYPYQKTTDFWYGGFDLILKQNCSSKNKCKVMIENKNIHPVRIGYTPTNVNQTQDNKYFKTLRENEEYQKYNDTYLRYRIPSDLIQDIFDNINNENQKKN